MVILKNKQVGGFGLGIGLGKRRTIETQYEGATSFFQFFAGPDMRLFCPIHMARCLHCYYQWISLSGYMLETCATL